MSSQTFLRVAHRGGAALAPENTLAAFRHALTLPIDAIELDVQMSRDGHAVVFHDETVERLTEGSGSLLDLDLADLRSLNVAAHFAGGWPEPQSMPTLREALEVARTGKVQTFIEIKLARREGGSYEPYPSIAEAVIEEVLAQDMLTQVMIMSFDWAVLSHLKTMAPSVSTGALVSTETWPPRTSLAELVAQVQALQCSWIHLSASLFTPEIPTFLHANGLHLGIWTVNDEPTIQRLARAGVDALTTDRPDVFL